MGIGVSILLLAVGAILTFAVNANTSGSGFNLDTVGIILMFAGALGVVLTLVFWSSFSPRRRRRQVVDRSYDGDRVVEERRIRRDVP